MSTSDISEEITASSSSNPSTTMPSQDTTLATEPSDPTVRRPTAYSYDNETLRRLNHESKEYVSPKYVKEKLKKTSESSSPSEFSCNICFDTASHPVLTLCGHLFCWPCLHQWLESQAQNPLCPVCKAGCEEDKIIPIYGRGKEPKDPRKEIPSRPKAQRPEPRPQSSFNFFSSPAFHNMPLGGGHFMVSAGFGLFPSLFGMQFVFPSTPTTNQANTQNIDHPDISPQQIFISRMFLLIGAMVLLVILLY